MPNTEAQSNGPGAWRPGRHIERASGLRVVVYCRRSAKESIETHLPKQVAQRMSMPEPPSSPPPRESPALSLTVILLIIVLIVLVLGLIFYS